MITKATRDDMARVMACARAFHAYGVWKHVPLDEAAFEAFAGALIDGAGVILLSDDGFCGGILSPAYFNPSFVIAAELFWWGEGEGRALREAFEAWAQQHGANAVQFSAMADDRLPAVSRLYRMAGYQPVECGFVKEYC